MQNFKKRTPFFLNVYLPQNVDADIADNLQKMADGCVHLVSAMVVKLKESILKMATKFSFVYIDLASLAANF
jgi:hypothetical protein